MFSPPLLYVKELLVDVSNCLLAIFAWVEEGERAVICLNRYLRQDPEKIVDVQILEDWSQDRFFIN